MYKWLVFQGMFVSIRCDLLMKRSLGLDRVNV